MIPARGRAPSALLPLAYLLTAAVAFVLAALAVLWLPVELAGHYYHPRILALAHTVTVLDIRPKGSSWLPLTVTFTGFARSFGWSLTMPIAACCQRSVLGR